MKPVALIVLDGWGIAAPGPGNALSQARLPVWDSLGAMPKTTLEASGPAVGLAPGQAGNSNVGHMHIGAGRVVVSDVRRIDLAIEDGSFLGLPALAGALQAPRLHVLGLFSDGGVHSTLRHWQAIVQARAGKNQTFYHLFTDGRDVAPNAAAADLEAASSWPAFQVATLGGRYFAMDRDHRWSRIEKAYRAIVDGEGVRRSTWREALEESYRAQVTDEFIEPVTVDDYQGARPGDQFLFVNFRADRARELSHALTDAEFPHFARPLGTFDLTTLTSYEEQWLRATAVFATVGLDHTLGQEVSAAGLRQARVAETEKYAHVTYFLDGGREDAFLGEARRVVPSPKVRTYDLKPEMSAEAVTDAGLLALDEGADLLVLNYANPDMVGHTGNVGAAILAVETVDRELGRLLAGIEQHSGLALVIADHGNVEMMIDPQTGGPHTAHTANLVPAVLVGMPQAVLYPGGLKDVAPTLLQLLGLPKPDAMTGRSLLSSPNA